MSTSTSLLFKADAPLLGNPSPSANIHTPLSEGHTPLSAHIILEEDHTPLNRHTPHSEGHSPFSHHSALSSGHTPQSSPSRSPRRLGTDPSGNFSNEELRHRTHKRIIVCCDGTWQDGVSRHRSVYTNILRLARTINHEDIRPERRPPIQQVVFYQSGIGSEHNFYSEYIEGTTGSSLADKVEEAYAFIAHNYFPGDEIFLFGFSRGAYTARMVAMFIGEIGVLDRKDMDHFAGIFIAYQRLGKSTNDAGKSSEIKRLNEKLFKWNQHDSPGKKRADSDGDTFTIKCLGVFDTVGSLGLPEEFTLRSKRVRTLFGFPDRILGEHIERAYQALALHETRVDFKCNLFEQTPDGMQKGQILKQYWFTGCHSDIGGGYREHDLADLALVWMVANVGDMLSLDLKYLSGLPNPVASWGQQVPHDPTTGIFSLAKTIQRPLPTSLSDVTHEVIHPSVLEQASLYPALAEVIEKYPEIIGSLLPLEEEMKVNWPFDKQSPVVRSYTNSIRNQMNRKKSVTQTILDAGSKFTKSIFKDSTRKSTGIKTEAGEVVYERNQLGDAAQKVGIIDSDAAPALSTG